MNFFSSQNISIPLFYSAPGEEEEEDQQLTESERDKEELVTFPLFVFLLVLIPTVLTISIHVIIITSSWPPI